jgi:hypothetical protein
MTSHLPYPVLGRRMFVKRGESICFQWCRTFDVRLHRDDRHLRAVFNYKRIPFRTEWVEIPDIEPLSKKLGINPNGQKHLW